MKKIIKQLVQALAGFGGKKAILVPKKQSLKGRTAVQALAGFWYIGDIADPSDIAYGLLCNGQIEAQGTSLVSMIVTFFLTGGQTIVVYDIGANTGYYGLLAAYIGKGSVQLFSFEPVSEFVQTIQDSLQLNRLEDQAKVFSVALGDVNKESDLFVIGTGTTLEASFVKGQKVEPRKVKQQKLDDLVRQENIPLPQFIKMDVEGFEYQVLLGAENVFKQALPVVWYESLEKNEQNGFINSTFLDTQKYFYSLGYTLYCLQQGRLVEIASVHNTNDMFLAIHPSKHQSLLVQLLSQTF